MGLQHIKPMSFSKFKVPRFHYLFLLFLGIQTRPRNMFMERERERDCNQGWRYLHNCIYIYTTNQKSLKQKNTHLSKLNTEKSLKNPQIKCLRYNNFNMYLIKWLMANTQQNDHFHFSPIELMKPKNIKFQVQQIYVSTCKISVYAQ